MEDWCEEMTEGEQLYTCSLVLVSCEFKHGHGAHGAIQYVKQFLFLQAWIIGPSEQSTWCKRKCHENCKIFHQLFFKKIIYYKLFI